MDRPLKSAHAAAFGFPRDRRPNPLGHLITVQAAAPVGLFPRGENRCQKLGASLLLALQQAHTALATAFPQLAAAPFVETWAGMIESSPDVLPIISGALMLRARRPRKRPTARLPRMQIPFFKLESLTNAPVQSW